MSTPFQIKKEDFSKEIEWLQRTVGKYFPIYDVKLSYNTVGFFCRISEETVDEKFDLLRRELVPQNYIPLLTLEKNDYVIYITKKPSAKYRSRVVNVVLLIATILTTVLAGAIVYIEYEQGGIPINPLTLVRMSFTPHYLLFGGICFALPLMTILGVHELGHYYMCRRHSVSASLPFFIPVPPYYFFPVGTFGAFISVREPIPNKKALIDIGFAGPIAGFVVAVPVLAIGLYLTSYCAQPVPADVSNTMILAPSILGPSIFYEGLRNLIAPQNVLVHPTAFAGWVGLLVTALNLLPAGQLDGGHIARALLGEKAKYASYCAIAFLFGIGMYYSAAGSGSVWLFFAIIIIFLGVKHPPPLNDITKLDLKRKLIGGFAIAILVTCFVAEPLRPVELDYDFEFGLMDGEAKEKYVPLNSTLTYNFTVKNVGNAENELKINAEIGEPPPYPYIMGIRPYNNTTADLIQVKNCLFKLSVNKSVNFTIVLLIPNTPDLAGKNFTMNVTMYTKMDWTVKPQEISCTIHVKDAQLIQRWKNEDFVYTRR